MIRILTAKEASSLVERKTVRLEEAERIVAPILAAVDHDLVFNAEGTRAAGRDVHLALETVDASQFEAFGSLAREWERAAERGLGGQDVTAVTRALEQGAGAL